MAQARTSTAMGLEHESDEILVAIARRRRARAKEARNELICRYRRPACSWISHAAGSWVWNRADLEDAYQQAVFWIHRAINKYDSGKGRFRTFLRCLVASRLKDLRKHLWRQERRCNRSVVLEDVPSPERTNPVVVAMHRELSQRLEQVVAGLTENDRLAYLEMLERTPLAEMAKRLGITYSQAKQLRRRVSSYLHVKLGNFIGGG